VAFSPSGCLRPIFDNAFKTELDFKQEDAEKTHRLMCQEYDLFGKQYQFDQKE